MKSITCYIALLVLIAAIKAQPSKISACPSQCACVESLCRRKRGNLKCRGVAVNCYQQNITTLPGGIPKNVTGLLLSKNGFKYLDFASFSNFTRLTDLLVDDNGLAKLFITARVRRLLKLSLQNNIISSLPLTNLTHLELMKDLYLENNRISNIRDVSFPVKLEKLNLNKNYITELLAGSFRKMKRLRVLKLNNNKISFIHPRAFRYLKRLEVMELASNLLTTIPDHTFTGLIKAFYLNLKNNLIEETNQHSFRLFGSKHPGHLQIRLENNQLQFITTEMFGSLTERSSGCSVYLAGNPIFCDCNLQNFHNASSDVIADAARTFCVSPAPYAATSVENLYIDDCCL